MPLLQRRKAASGMTPRQFDQGQSKPLPAPVGGLNLRDDINDLKPNEALALENWLPGDGKLTVRPGKTSHATGMGSGEVKTLAAFAGYSATALIAGANGNIYNATSAGAASSLASGFGQDRWQTALYSDRLFFVNGTDTPQVYNGSTVSTIAWTGAGLTNTNLINVALVRNRLWFAEKNQAWAWYGAVGQITAASSLTKFQLEQIAGGGYLMAIGSWSRDGGDGADDLIVFVMSTGELLIYQGDPATTFSLIGKFRGAPPIGRPCLFQVGGELVVITDQGLLPLSTAIGGTATARDIAAIDPWGKVAPGFVADALADKANGGWHGVFHNGLVWINVPTEPGSLSKQRVLNTRTGAWTDFNNLNGSAFAVHQGEMYFGAMSGGKVWKASGGSDDGSPIPVRSVGAFVFPSRQTTTNVYTAVRPRLRCGGALTGIIGAFTDFDVGDLTGPTVEFSTVGSTSAWNTSPWDATPWASPPTMLARWYSVRGSGKSVAVAMTALAGTPDIEWYSSDILYKVGGIR